MKKTRFILSQKNQKGQVAIFVALIFQVIFVFFALLINVGLLVHHKINLQQSADLAAYYGAMKQAESLNAIAHINYQIRQSWKLLAWRYRVLGTFGNQKWSGDSINFPLNIPGAPNAAASINSGGAPNCSINGESFSTSNLPFFCIGHSGFSGWTSGNENNCKLSCNNLSGLANTINSIPNIGAAAGMTGVASGIRSAIDSANRNLNDKCVQLAPANMNLLGGFIASYYSEQYVRSKTLLMLAANISKDPAEEILDLDGNLVLTGVKNTLKNNLTEANLTSLNDSKIKIINGLSDSNCRMATDANAGSKQDSRQFLKRIEFKFVHLFSQSCSSVGGANYKAESIFTMSPFDIASIFQPNPILRDIIMTLESKDNSKFTVGYEKNPWCQSYYGVRAESEPKIPFLPLSKIKLSAVSIAKPFGGSIGPWFGKEWPSGAKNTQDSLGTDQSKQTDTQLPVMAFPTTGQPKLSDAAKMTLNFSRFVGDSEGLANWNYLGEYHAALLTRFPKTGDVGLGSIGKTADTSSQTLSTPNIWPSRSSWKDAYDMDSSDYDPLTKIGNNDSNLRDLEISAIAPNQFDLTYYSIDPDFYNNYYTRISDPNIFAKLKNAANGLGPDASKFVRPDFGNNERVYSRKKSFSVRNQIEIVKKVFENQSSGITNAASNFLSAFPELVTKQASLLTGWTFLNFSDYSTFPSVDKTPPETNMTFGRCFDKDWQGTDSNPDYKTPPEFSADLPPTPGNCVTGGRVGYSVKLVSPSVLRSTVSQPLGGPNTSGPILNPVPDSFLNF